MNALACCAARRIAEGLVGTQVGDRQLIRSAKGESA
jgi:hypothetical protein